MEHKKCPFCGFNGEVHQGKIAYPGGRKYYYPTCSEYGCPAYVETAHLVGGCYIECKTEEEAWKLWDTRVGE